MMRMLVTGFLIAHGGIHAAIWMSPRQAGAPFDPDRSWLFGDVRPVTLVLAAVAAVTFVAAGVGYFAGFDWWAVAGTAGAVVSIGLLALTFTPWWLAALAINAALVIVASPSLAGALR